MKYGPLCGKATRLSSITEPQTFSNNWERLNSKKKHTQNFGKDSKLNTPGKNFIFDGCRAK
jgi:hypothetical protein